MRAKAKELGVDLLLVDTGMRKSTGPGFEARVTNLLTPKQAIFMMVLA